MAKKKEQAPHFSEGISAVCKMMDDAMKDYAWNYDQLMRMDQLTQDYLHKLELDDLSYSERAKIATQLRNCRKIRREHKDTKDTLEPLVQFLESDRGKNMMNFLREALGKTRKVEAKMVNRIYRPRVLSAEEFSSTVNLRELG